jgi:hypothetical protein
MSRHLRLGRFRSILIIFENALQNRKCKRTLSYFRQDFVLQIWPSPLETAEGGREGGPCRFKSHNGLVQARPSALTFPPT